MNKSIIFYKEKARVSRTHNESDLKEKQNKYSRTSIK